MLRTLLRGVRVGVGVEAQAQAQHLEVLQAQPLRALRRSLAPSPSINQFSCSQAASATLSTGAVRANFVVSAGRVFGVVAGVAGLPLHASCPLDPRS